MMTVNPPSRAGGLTEYCLTFVDGTGLGYRRDEDLPDTLLGARSFVHR